MKYSVKSSEKISDSAELYSLTFTAADMAEKAAPGQILHFECGGETASMRRPLSICDVKGDDIRVCFEVRGKGTAELASRVAGAGLDVIGPYGHGFPVEGIMGGDTVYLVGGGIGIYPLLFAARKIKDAGGRPVALLGFRSRELINMTEEFEGLCESVKIATDDGSYGFHGYVTQLLDECLNVHMGQVFVCGPRPMMANAAKVSSARGAKCFVSMEERMGCGVGACLACVCRTLIVGNDGLGEKYRRVCVDGPVFASEEIIWE